MDLQRLNLEQPLGDRSSNLAQEPCFSDWTS